MELTATYTDPEGVLWCEVEDHILVSSTGRMTLRGRFSGFDAGLTPFPDGEGTRFDAPPTNAYHRELARLRRRRDQLYAAKVFTRR